MAEDSASALILDHALLELERENRLAQAARATDTYASRARLQDDRFLIVWATKARLGRDAGLPTRQSIIEELFLDGARSGAGDALFGKHVS